ncbi:MAG TPA: histidinol-phosphate transaminase [Rhodocyclaceae bacterium]|nr:histidinol-phosphate transaminase [Rhodocyclaceae bacterium]
MSIATQSPPYTRSLSPYIPGKPISQLAREMGIPVENIVKLASNENPLGMSPRARRAIARAMEGAARYPDQFDLIAALAERHQVAAAQIVLGNGSNDVLEMAARVFLAPQRSAVFSEYAFAVYPLATQASGARGLVAPAKDYGHDPDALIAAIQDDTHLLWIANPNNPTGNFLPPEALRALLRRIPGHIAVVLDEAYNDYLAPSLRADTVRWIEEFPNLIVTRTFSKIYGLAGLRIGYAVAHADVADLMNRVRQPFNVNTLALAGALAALDDRQFLADSDELNRCGMEQLTAGFRRMELSFIPSYGNFITVAVADGGGVNTRLLREGVIVRPLAGYGLPKHLRITIGLESENRRLLDALERAIARE